MFNKILEISIFTFIFCTIINADSIDNSCLLKLADRPEKFPIMLRSLEKRTSFDIENFIYSEIVYPELIVNSREEYVPTIILNSNRQVLVACTGPRNYLVHNNKTYAKLSCDQGTLKLNEQNISFNETGCKKRPKSTLKKSLTGCGNGGYEGKIHFIGWKIKTGIFIPEITVCFDPQYQTTIFTSHIIKGSHIKMQLSDPARPRFKSGRLFTSDVKMAYTKNNQKKMLTNIFPGVGIGQYYLARGHLVPNSDFVYTAQKDATYYMNNCLPQWQSFNNGNWKALEFSIRALANRLSEDLLIHTGGYGIMTGESSQKAYLDPYMKAIPVPALFWKVIYSKIRSQAIAIIAVNSLNESDIIKEVNKFCPDVCNKITWVNWDIHNHKKGYTFCCSVKNIRKLIPYIPYTEETSLLNI